MRAVLALSLIALSGCTTEAPVSMGRADYGAYCAACHGAGGRGDGPAAAGLVRAPADLTVLSAENGGVFPLSRVMSHIDGYTRRADGEEMAMPEFGALLQAGRVLRVETEPGVMTPTPERLYALARYIETLQE